MRRLLLTLLVALIAVPAALASSRATGDGVLELKAVDGTVAIGTYAAPAKGALWGQMDKGKLTVYDPLSGDGSVYVSGWDTKAPVDLQGDGPDATQYTGTNLHFRVTGGRYKLTLTGQSIDLTAVGVGIAKLAGDPTVDDAGSYSLNSGKWIDVPTFLLPKQSWPVPFGDQTP
jgi:hypothetical protein